MTNPEGNIIRNLILVEYYPACDMRLLKWRQTVILLERVTLQGNMTEYYSACDMLSTTEINNIAYEY